MAPLLKDLYNTHYINLLSSQIQTFFPTFPINDFINSIFTSQWKDKALKERMRHISTTLFMYLPKDYPTAIDILKNTFSTMNHSYNLENMIFQDFVEVCGMDNFHISMDALEHFTINSSSEFAIRRFIIKYPTQTMQQMQKWTQSHNSHIRRLASEGCRPRLPWAVTLQTYKENPREVLHIINLLKNDTDKYVQKSVANNINDISKDNPQDVKELATQWIGYSKIRDSILKHGCRTLLKQSDPEILSLFGFHPIDTIELVDFSMNQNVKMGEVLDFSFSLKSANKLGKLRIEFALHFLRKNNTHNKKVFKIGEGNYVEQTRAFQKKYSFKTINTRVYYKGLQKLELLVNGKTMQIKEFMLS